MDGVLFLYTDLLKKVFLFIRMLGTKIGSGHVPKVFKLLQSCHLAPGLAAGSIVRAARNVEMGRTIGSDARHLSPSQIILALDPEQSSVLRESWVR